MSVSDEMVDPRLKRILSKLSDSNDDENAGSGLVRLTDAQMNAFKEVFDLFDSNGGGTIDAHELDVALRSVGMCLSQEDIIGVLETMDRDGNGEIDFTEFLNLMTNTEKFIESFETSKNRGFCLERENELREAMLFDALTQFMKSSALQSMQEIVGYFHNRSKRNQAPHVVGHYAAGARLIGLTEKQLQKHMEKIRASNANSSSPYARPLYNVNPNSGKKRVPLPASRISSCLGEKKRKIRLQFRINNAGSKTPDATTSDRRITNAKSVSEFRNSASDVENQQLRLPSVKRNGWVGQKAEPFFVHLPTVALKRKRRGIDGEAQMQALTFDDLPSIRKKVEKARGTYYKRVQKKEAAEAERHWQSLHTELITSDVMRERFSTVFQAYTALR